jgi:UDP-N-acetylglucosamine--N-acetylmuramyl-(pentapeptide) pyrophosphoryl-undecaprenol N-acetylglucosamine transferase
MARLLIMAGGTGGHIYPALAVAELWRQQGGEVVWLGTPDSMESRIVPQAGVALEQISISGLRGKGKGALLRAPLQLLRALWQSLRIIHRLRPDVVLGMGGFASGPGGVAAWLLRRPLVVHEQNAIAGLTNRLLARLATRVLEAFPGTFPRSAKVEAVGNPIRAALQPSPATGVHQPLRLLVLGGSLGAKRINALVPEMLSLLKQPLAVWHQTGVRNLQESKALYAQHGVTVDGATVRVVPYIEEMDRAYGWADLVLCRAGAMTVSELALVGRGAILVPFPFAVDDHQSANGRFLQQAGAAQLIQQDQLDAHTLEQWIRRWIEQPQQLLEMGERARALGAPEAGARVVEICRARCKHD